MVHSAGDTDADVEARGDGHAGLPHLLGVLAPALVGDVARGSDGAAEQLGRATWTIVTSCTRPLFEARWARTGLAVPAGLVTADQVSRGKPHPEPYLLGAERVGVAPEQCIVIEDSLGGLRSGTAAGASTIAVTSTTPAGDLAPLADALVTSLDDLEVRADGAELVLSRRGS